MTVESVAAVAKDAQGKVIKVGDKVARGRTHALSTWVEIARVTKVVDGRVYLDHSNVPLKFPDRVAIVRR